MSPDIIYANDIGYWDKAIAAHSQFANSKLILTILDLPLHLPEDCARQIEQVKNAKKQFPNAIFCTISEYCRKTINELCGVDCEVIYQPIKDITDLGIPWRERQIEYLIVGRNTDKMKGHYDVTIPCIQQMHGDIEKLHCVGEGFVGAQNYGNVTNEQLNIIYNNSKYIFCPSKFEGLGLQMPESIAAGAIPISYHHHPTAAEFLPKELIFDSVGNIIDFIKTNKTPELSVLSINQFRKEQIAQNIINAAKNSN